MFPAAELFHCATCPLCPRWRLSSTMTACLCPGLGCSHYHHSVGGAHQPRSVLEGQGAPRPGRWQPRAQGGLAIRTSCRTRYYRCRCRDLRVGRYPLGRSQASRVRLPPTLPQRRCPRTSYRYARSPHLCPATPWAEGAGGFFIIEGGNTERLLLVTARHYSPRRLHAGQEHEQTLRA